MTSEFELPDPDQDSDPPDELEIVDLVFSTLRDFRREMAPRLAKDGMFVSTEEPLARGTKVRFRFVLAEDFILAQGDAGVAWRRTRSSHPDLEPGMALWFTKVEAHSRAIIDELVDIQSSIGEVFDTRRKAGEVGEFVENEFAASFASSFDLPGLKAEPLPRSRKAEVGETPEVTASQAPHSEPPPDEEERRVDVDPDEDHPAPLTSGFSAPEPMAADDVGFEVSMMTDDPEPDVTPLSDAPGTVPDLDVVLEDAPKRSGRRNMWPLAGLAVVLLAAAAAIVWWTVIRPQGDPIAEVRKVVEAEPTGVAVELLDDSEEEGTTLPSEVVEEVSQPTASLEEDSQTPAVVEEPEPATRVIDVAVSRMGDATVVGIRGDGYFEDTRLQVSRLLDPERVLVRIARIETYYRPSEIEVGSPEVVRVRMGHHPELTPAKLFVVIDVADESVVVQDSSVSGDTIRIVVGRQ